MSTTDLVHYGLGQCLTHACLCLPRRQRCDSLEISAGRYAIVTMWARDVAGLCESTADTEDGGERESCYCADIQSIGGYGGVVGCAERVVCEVVARPCQRDEWDWN